MILWEVINTVWNTIAEDMFVNDEGETDPSIVYKNTDVVELSLDADRWRGRTDHDDVIVGDLIKRLYSLGVNERSELIDYILPYKTYGY